MKATTTEANRIAAGDVSLFTTIDQLHVVSSPAIEPILVISADGKFSSRGRPLEDLTRAELRKVIAELARAFGWHG